MACALNRVDIPVEQWERRAFEDDLICELDSVRDRLAASNAALVEVSGKLRAIKAEQAARLADWRARKGLPPHRTFLPRKTS